MLKSKKTVVVILVAAFLSGLGVVDAKAEDIIDSKATVVVEKIASLPDNPKALNKSINNRYKKQIAQLVIKDYVFTKYGFSTNKGIEVTIENFKKALTELILVAADMKFGNNDGVATPDEVDSMIASCGGNPGFEQLIDISKNYSVEFK